MLCDLPRISYVRKELNIKILFLYAKRLQRDVPYIRVRECDYNRDPQAEIDRCINFIETTRTLQSLNEI